MVCRLYGTPSHLVYRLKISPTTLSKLEAQAKAYNAGIGKKKKVRRRPDPRAVAAYEWLLEFFDSVADKSPTRNQIFLPMHCTWHYIYERYLTETKPPVPLKLYSFIRSITTSMQRDGVTVIQPRRTRLGRCNICALIDAMQALVNTPEQRKQLKQLKEEHVKLQRQERQAYEQRRQQAKKHPDQFLSTIIDKTKAATLPWRYTPKKCEIRQGKLNIDIVGILDHGASKRYFYLIPPGFPIDSNVTLTLLLSYLNEIRASRGGTLPPTWFLQMDNCKGENKNCFVLGFCAALVAMGWFREIVVSFLISGHTHEDIDRAFSIIWR